jgi:citronellol/citronellal dehydrogenase
MNETLSGETLNGKTLQGKTLFITGATRGIGLAIALRAARDGANVIIAGRSIEHNPRLPGTIFTAAAEIEEAGGVALPLRVDLRDEQQVRAAIAEAAKRFGGIDIVVNNAASMTLADTRHVDMARFDMMHQVNVRGAFMVSKFALPFLERAPNPHVLMIAPPLDLRETFFAAHTAFSMSKFAMSMMALGLAAELRSKGVAVNALWPRTFISTPGIPHLPQGQDNLRASRNPDIMADAAHVILTQDAKAYTGKFLIDETVLTEQGETDFGKYAIDDNEPLASGFLYGPPRAASARLAKPVAAAV